MDDFSPLALVHLALDKLGKGAPCGIAAFFPNQSEEQLAASVEHQTRQLPLVHRRIDLSGIVPKFMPPEPDSAFVRVSGKSLEDLLRFSISDTHGLTGWYVLHPRRNGCWFIGIWAHAIVDGHSMLRFISRLTSTSSRQEEPAKAEGRTITVARFLPWMVRAGANEWKSKLAFHTFSEPQGNVTWINAPPHAGEALRAMARRVGSGVTGLLCAALVQAFYKSSLIDTSGKLQFLVPITRTACHEVNGFGFGIGWLMPELHVTPASKLQMMATSFNAQIRSMADSGWDKNLERALGKKYSRVSARVARTLRRGRADFIATVSWKGWVPYLGTEATCNRVACFATVQPNTSLCHVSGHIDQSGLSLSLSSRMPAGIAQRLFKNLLACLEIDATDGDRYPPL